MSVDTTDWSALAAGLVWWAGRDDADRAVRAARRAFDEGPWPRLRPREHDEVAPTRAGDLRVPFGGVKRSGSGRDRNRHALEDYTDLETTWIKHG
jgi:acyl-CoA reductase-like NAD-dependent aldehyde dehydrogenase